MLFLLPSSRVLFLLRHPVCYTPGGMRGAPGYTPGGMRGAPGYTPVGMRDMHRIYTRGYGICTVCTPGCERCTLVGVLPGCVRGILVGVLPWYHGRYTTPRGIYTLLHPGYTRPHPLPGTRAATWSIRLGARRRGPGLKLWDN